MADRNITIARSMYYEFFALPLFFSEDDSKFRLWQDQLSYLKTSPIEETNLTDFKILERFNYEDFKSEQNELLFGYSYDNIPLTASFYNEGRDDGAMRQQIISTMRKSKFRRDSELCRDSEDFIGFVFYLMSSLLRDEIDGNNFLSTELFVNVINDFIDEFEEFIKANQKAKFFKSLANLMDSFFSFERAALGVKALQKEKSFAKESLANGKIIGPQKFNANNFELFD